METFSALLALCAGNSPVTGEFPAQRPVTRSFDVFFDLRLNKRLSKQSWGWWFETPSHPLWRHCNGGPGAPLTKGQWCGLCFCCLFCVSRSLNLSRHCCGTGHRIFYYDVSKALSSSWIHLIFAQAFLIECVVVAIRNLECYCQNRYNRYKNKNNNKACTTFIMHHALSRFPYLYCWVKFRTMEKMIYTWLLTLNSCICHNNDAVKSNVIIRSPWIVD